MKNHGVTVIIVLGMVIIVVYSLSPSYRDQTDKYPTLANVRSNFTLLDPKFAKIPLRAGDSAYTENKEVITLCLTNPETKRGYDMNTIMYVALHELAHVITPDGSAEHGPEFKQNFSTLLRRASETQIYNPHIPIPATYCNVGTR